MAPGSRGDNWPVEQGSERLRILLSGMIAGIPGQGGATWAVLQYALGFKRLGHEVLFVEQCDAETVMPAGIPLDRSDSASYFHKVVSAFGLEDSSALLVGGERETVGLPYERLVEMGRDADLLVNIAGTLTDETLFENVPVRVYLDLDPAFSQLWATEGIDMHFEGHTRFVTVGQAIGTPECDVPTCGREWLATVPPVVLSHWPRGEHVAHDALTTVGNWRAYGSIEHGGVHYGQKAHSLRRFVSLPKHTEASFLLALSIHPDEKKDIEALGENGWGVVDAATVVETPQTYAEFIRGSMAELGVAKSGYVVSRCGWFSDRSVCYLASGRPVIAQETGFSRFLPMGEGLFAFETGEDALGPIADVLGDYKRNSDGARSLAEEYFESDKVLGNLLENVGRGS
jgi:hypothetical protein